MKKEAFLESLLSSAERIDSYSGYSNNMDFAFAFAVLKVNIADDDVTKEYELFKKSNVLTYKRVHAYIVNKGSENFLYLFKNSVPGRIKYTSEGGDSDLCSQRLKDNLVYTVSKSDRMYPSNEHNFFRVYRIVLTGKADANDISEDREYILKNIRKNSNGIPVCWHVYPYVREGRVVLDILEHNNPNNDRIVYSEGRELNENVHYLPVEKDGKNWKKYINK